MPLESLLISVINRAERFKQLKEAFSRGEYSITPGPEVNDFSSLKEGLYQEDLEGIEIPPDLVDEANWALTETYQLGFRPLRSPSEQERGLKQARFVEYFKKCEAVERKLYQLLLEYNRKHLLAQV